MGNLYIAKGDKVKVHYRTDADFVSLEDHQLKFSCKEYTVIGTVRHVRGDHPTEPKNFYLNIEAEDGIMCLKCLVKEVEINKNNIIDISLVDKA